MIETVRNIINFDNFNYWNFFIRIEWNTARKKYVFAGRDKVVVLCIMCDEGDAGPR